MSFFKDKNLNQFVDFKEEIELLKEFIERHNLDGITINDFMRIGETDDPNTRSYINRLLVKARKAGYMTVNSKTQTYYMKD